MISETAMEDIAKLRADGIEVPPREVIRLNALGLKLERGADSPECYAAPRVAFVRGVTFNEPTLGAEMWLRQAQDAFNVDDEETLFSLRVMSCVVPWRELPKPTNLRAVQNAAKAVLERLRAATYRQVLNALDWCIYGNAPEDDELPPPRQDDEEKTPDELPERYSPEYGLFYRGVAAKIGTAADLKDLTYSAMLYVCDRAEKLETAGSFNAPDKKAAHNKASGDYFSALDAIRAAAQKPDEAADSEGEKEAEAVDGAQQEGAE